MPDINYSFLNPAVPSVGNIFWNESVTSLAASATFNGASRDTGGAVGSYHRHAAFNVYAFSDQAGTVRVEVSLDGITWRRASADVAVAANSAVILSVPVTTRFNRAVYVNGAAAQTAFMLNTSYTVS